MLGLTCLSESLLDGQAVTKGTCQNCQVVKQQQIVKKEARSVVLRAGLPCMCIRVQLTATISTFTTTCDSKIFQNHTYHCSWRSSILWPWSPMDNLTFRIESRFSTLVATCVNNEAFSTSLHICLGVCEQNKEERVISTPISMMSKAC